MLCAGMDINANGMISYQELLKGYDRLSDFQKLMDVMDITRSDLESIFYVLDEDTSGEVSYLEFCSSLGNFFKREPIIMHSLVRYSVMEIRKILRQEVGSSKLTCDFRSLHILQGVCCRRNLTTSSGVV